MRACLKSPYLWNGIQRLGLTTNMRVRLNGDPSAQQFADNLLKLGNYAITPDNQDGCIAMQSIGRFVKTQQELKEAVFPNVAQHFTDHSWLCPRVILATRNEDVSVMNKQLSQESPDSVQVCKSIGTKCDINQAFNYPTEFLNKLEPSGVPSHTLELRIWAPIILLRNLHPPSLCNGKTLCIKKLMSNIIKTTIMTGHAAEFIAPTETTEDASTKTFPTTGKENPIFSDPTTQKEEMTTKTITTKEQTTPTEEATTKAITNKEPTTPTEEATTKAITTKEPTTPTEEATTKAITTKEPTTPTEEATTKAITTKGTHHFFCCTILT
ncbi:hypothetical protein AVEN_53063-1 [Araneus ventricosus]|uniref:DNA helicase Pif1-like 2B domain-containing protein n=1 Tax=Araneus ventricosus TaxID=182803 RepID=A0A4Y2PHA3_ARAVE|nr:hypothetical protein AVEN_53063-1 [Araneus ventricosus]